MSLGQRRLVLEDLVPVEVGVGFVGLDRRHRRVIVHELHAIKEVVQTPTAACRGPGAPLADRLRAARGAGARARDVPHRIHVVLVDRPMPAHLAKARDWHGRWKAAGIAILEAMAVRTDFRVQDTRVVRLAHGR